MGERLGEYELLTSLGEGSMGKVVLARHVVTGVRYALKLLELNGVEPEAVLRFQREAEAQAAVDAHPNVLRVHGLSQDRGTMFLVLEHAAGGDLAARLARGRLPPDQAVRVMRDLARGLAHVHARGILHRDLKPANVLFDERGTPKLVDFGIARVRGAARLTGTGGVVGTPAYMPPEQARGGAVDERSDVYGLGAVLYHCLTGRPPFEARSMVEQLLLLTERDPVPPGKLAPDVSPALEAVVLRALARSPEARQRDAATLAEELERALIGEPAPRRGRVALLVGLALAAPLLVALAVGLPAGPAPEPTGAAALPSAAAGLPPSATLPAPRRRTPQEVARDPRLRKRAREMAGAILEVERLGGQAVDDWIELGRFLRHGTDGAPEDRAAALDLFHAAEEAGSPEAAGELGLCQLVGRDLPRDLDAGLTRLLAAQDWHKTVDEVEALIEERPGDPDLRWVRAALVEGPRGRRPDPRSFARELREAVRSGSRRALRSLEEGVAATDSWGLAAQGELGRVCLQGAEAAGLGRDPARAEELLRSAAEAGWGVACHHLASAMDEGALPARPGETAMEWYVRGAYAGHTDSLVAAANRARAGVGTDLDAAQAARWYREAGQERRQALRKAAEMELTGELGPPDPGRASLLLASWEEDSRGKREDEELERGRLVQADLALALVPPQPERAEELYRRVAERASTPWPGLGREAALRLWELVLSRDGTTAAAALEGWLERWTGLRAEALVLERARAALDEPLSPPPERRRARERLLRAASRGQHEALARLRRLRGQLEPDELAELDRLDPR